MSRIPAFLLRHSVTVEPYQGNTANGPSFGPGVAVACFLEEGNKLTRDKDGHEVTSTAQLYARLDTVAPPQSRVTLPDGRVSTVIQAMRRDGGGMPTPDHLEVHLQ